VTAEGPPDIKGVEAVVKWFGEWPSFHDAEVLSLHINRGGTSQLRIFTFITGNRVDSAHYFIRENEGVVVFEFSGITSLDLDGEDADVQNVISGLAIERVQKGYALSLGPCYGLAGEITVRELTVRVEPYDKLAP
jgi:hypothetical protein